MATISSLLARILSTLVAGEAAAFCEEPQLTVSPADFSDDVVRAGLRRDLLAWFDAQRRDLPWRRRRSLYGTWISEMMLQQTTVATVVPYWERFLERFPDVQALAAAPEEDVLAHWSGLGYYRRARQLHAAARLVVAEFDGVLPDSVDGWRGLPGIGPYAAGAIASIGLGLPAAAVDANVRRVLARWLGASGQPGSLRTGTVEGLADALVRGDRPDAWNEALMELGALVCQARVPLCASCPVRSVCGVHGLGVAADPVERDGRPAAVPVQVVLIAFVVADHVWLEPPGGRLLDCRVEGPPARQEFGKLHQGLLTLPTTAWYRRPPRHSLDLVGALSPGWAAAAGFPGAGPACRAGGFRHAITRYRLAVDVAVAEVSRNGDGRNPGGGPEPEVGSGRPGRWVRLAEAPDLNISQLARKALRRIADARG